MKAALDCSVSVWLFLSLLFVATQVFFFVQSSFVLVEVLVALLVFLSLYFYATEKYLLAVLSLSMLFFIRKRVALCWALC